jgi:hypothetical protein
MTRYVYTPGLGPTPPGVVYSVMVVYERNVQSCYKLSIATKRDIFGGSMPPNKRG